VTQLNDDVAAIDPNVAIDTGVSTAYMSTDMFIQALKTVAEKGEQYITPENVRLAAAHQTWEIEGLAGPTKYPDSTVMSTPACAGYALATATEWRTIVPFACTDKRWPILPEYED
jgi:hypothetical protein